MGLAVVAIDTVEHGEHPTSEGGELQALPFLGVDLSEVTFDLTTLRGNFNQTAFDRLQLLELLHTDADIDGDGVDDLDLDQMSFLGISLGGMVGPALLSLTDDFHAGAMPVAGGHMVAFAVEGEVFELVLPFFESVAGSAEAFERYLLVGQMIVDPGDPATWAAHVLHDRLVEGRVPDVLLPVSKVDRTVPPPAGRALARGLGVPHLPPVVEAVDGLEVSEEAPLVGNLDGISGAYFQLDRITSGDGVAPSDHNNAPWSPEGTQMLRTFFQAWLDGGPAEIIDPYEALGTPPLAE